MATGKSATRKAPALKAASHTTFQLRDLRVVSLKCERLLAPEATPKGTVSLESRVGLHVKKRANDATTQLVVLSLEMQVTGKATEAKESVKVGDASFKIDLKAEGLFFAKGDEVSEGSSMKTSELQRLVDQAHPLAILYIRRGIEDMGYRNVKMSLGFDPERVQGPLARKAGKSIALQSRHEQDAKAN